MEQTLPKTLKTFNYTSLSTKENHKKRLYNCTTRATKLYIPIDINVFKIGDYFNIIKTLEGFLIKRSHIDSRKHVKFNRTRTILLDGTLNHEEIHGEYEYEILDEDTLKLIRI